MDLSHSIIDRPLKREVHVQIGPLGGVMDAALQLLCRKFGVSASELLVGLLKAKMIEWNLLDPRTGKPIDSGVIKLKEDIIQKEDHVRKSLIL